MIFTNVSLFLEEPGSFSVNEENYACMLSVISRANWSTKRLKYAD